MLGLPACQLPSAQGKAAQSSLWGSCHFLNHAVSGNNSIWVNPELEPINGSGLAQDIHPGQNPFSFSRAIRSCLNGPGLNGSGAARETNYD